MQQARRRLATAFSLRHCLEPRAGADARRRLASSPTFGHALVERWLTPAARGYAAAASIPTNQLTDNQEANSAREGLPLAVPAYSVWGANTNVGKTLVSVGLAHAAAVLQVPLSYVKPVQTGFPADSDARLVALACGGSPNAGPHAAEAAGSAVPLAGAPPAPGAAGGVPGSAAVVRPAPQCTTLFAWCNAVSPHLAVRLEGRPVSDEALVAATTAHVRQAMTQLRLQQQQQAAETGVKAEGRGNAAAAADDDDDDAVEGSGGAAPSALLLMETAGGVTSPAPSGRLACDVLRPLRFPAVLVGDPRLGGIAATLSAYDSLVARGWDVEAVVLVGQHSVLQASVSASNGDGEGGVVPLDNLSFLREYFRGPATTVHRLGTPPPEVVGVPACPPAPPGHNVRRDGLDSSLAAWLPASLPAFSALLTTLLTRHRQRVARLLADRTAAEAHIWWPFTQHAALTHGSATLVDGRCGETWTALAAPAGAAGAGSGGSAAATALVPLYDASGSWWTQAATPALQPEIARAVSYAAGRYLHVLFAEVAHQPAVAAATVLLRGPGAGWAARVFFSDDGSTAVEVALKMAFRKFLADRGELGGELGGDGAAAATAAAASGGAATDSDSSGGGELFVLGLRGAYHGDTLGAQDCVAPSIFNGPLQAPWYRGRGLFLEPPYVGMTKGRWYLLEPPAWLTARLPAAELPSWASLDDMLTTVKESDTSSAGGADGGVTATTATSSALNAAYRSYINAAIDDYEAAEVESGDVQQQQRRRRRLAACIMEPLLQGAGGMLVVEPGFQRAVAEVCRARRLPLILDEVFSGLFRTGALTAASAIGVMPDIACYGKLLTGGAAPMAVTLASEAVFEAFKGPSKLFALLHGHSYTAYPIGCAAAAASLDLLTHPATNPNLCAPGRCPNTPACTQPCGRLLRIWDAQTVSDLSYHPLAKRVVAVGSVLAVELQTQGSGGYASAGAVQVVRRLRDEHGIYARPLGSVVYLMVPPTAPRSTAAWLAGCLRAVLDACASEAHGSGVPEESVVV